MKIKDFAAGILTGIAAGIVVSEVFNRMNRHVPADTVLNELKEAFKQEGPIDGSWIVMKTEPFTKHKLPMEVYRGGISRVQNGELEQFEFAADARTGSIVELSKV